MRIDPVGSLPAATVRKIIGLKAMVQNTVNRRRLRRHLAIEMEHERENEKEEVEEKEEEYALILECQHDPPGLRVCDGNGGDRCTVVGGDLQSLIRYVLEVVDDEKVKRNYNEVILLTIRSLLNPSTLFMELERQFELMGMQITIGHQMTDSLKGRIEENQRRIAEWIQLWTEKYTNDFRGDPKMLQRFESFVARISERGDFAAGMLQNIFSQLKQELSRPEPPPPFVRKRIEMSLEEARSINYQIFNSSPIELAVQLTILEFNLLSKIRPNEFLKRSWKKNAAPNLEQWILWSEGTRDWVSTVLLENPKENLQNLVDYFTQVALEMFKLKNFNGCYSIISGFRNPEGDLLGFSNLNPQLIEMESLFSSPENLERFYDGMGHPHCIPLLQPFLREMALLDVSLLDYLGGNMINFQKSKLEWKVMNDFFETINSDSFGNLPNDEKLQVLLCRVNFKNRSALWNAQKLERDIISEFSKEFEKSEEAVDINDLEPHHDNENELTLEEEDLEKLMDMAIQRTYSPGYQIVKEGEFNSKFFIILEGTVNLTRRNKRHGEYLVTSMSVGQFFGNASTLTFGSATGTISVSQDGPAVIAEIGSNQLSEMVNRDPNLSIEVGRCVIQSFIKKINTLPRPIHVDGVKDGLNDDEDEEHLTPGLFPPTLELPPSETFCVATFQCRVNYVHKGNLYLSPNFFSFLNDLKSLRKKLVVPVESIQKIEMIKESHIKLTLKDNRIIKFQFFRQKGAGKDCFNIMGRIISSHKSSRNGGDEPKVECVGFELSLSDLDMKEHDWQSLFQIGQTRIYPAETVVHCEKDGERLLYIIISGSCREVTDKGLLLDVMVEEETFSETEFFEGRNTGNKVQTAEESEIFSMTIEALEKFSVDNPKTVALFFSHVAQVLAARWNARETRARRLANYRDDYKISPVSILNPCVNYPAEKEGKLWQKMEKKEKGNPVMEERYCKVRGGFLMVYNTTPEKKGEAMEKNEEHDDSVEGIVRVFALSGLKLVAVRSLSALYMQIVTPSGTMTLTAGTMNELISWMGTLHQWTTTHYRFNSFAPIRNKVNCVPIVDGENAYRAMAEAMESATMSIFVNDWWMVPQLYLKRGEGELTDENRLDLILHRKAAEGVRVFVLVWNETDLASRLGSVAVRGHLEKLHPNIKVIRHPMIIPFEWSHHQKGIVVDQKIAFVGGLDFCFGRWDTQQHQCVDEDARFWKGSDYYNTTFGEPEDPDKPFEDYLDRKKTPRLPWHDVHMRIEGEGAKDVAYNFIQRWNHHKEAHPEYQDHPYLIPQPSSETNSSYESRKDKGTCNIQIVRSIAQWSSGNIRETSMQKAYLDLIENSEHYIYIENQFFVSSTSGNQVRNKIAQALVDRISRAIRENKPYHVFVLLPVTPEGPFEEAASVRYIMDLQWQTILRKDTSIYEQLKSNFPGLDPENYISFFGLRSHGRVSGKLVTEQIYIHAKIMIADDCRVVISSANINDRSLNGTRDSEIGALVEDMDPVHSRMGGKEFVKSKFAVELRNNLWMEHLGLSKEELAYVEDPISPDSLALWRRRAESNSSIYSRSFPWLPSDEIKTLAQLKEIRKIHPEAIEGDLSQIVGQVVVWPLHFLENEDSKLKPGLHLHKIRRFDKIFQ